MYKKTLTGMIDRGYSITKIKNTWLDDSNPYKGINVQLESPQEQKFELQFHTQESFDLKNSKEMHGLYEQARILSPGTDEYFEIEDKMFDLSEQLEEPDNITEIQNYRR